MIDENSHLVSKNEETQEDDISLMVGIYIERQNEKYSQEAPHHSQPTIRML